MVPFKTFAPSTPIIATSSNPPDQLSQTKRRRLGVPDRESATNQLLEEPPPFFFQEFS